MKGDNWLARRRALVLGMLGAAGLISGCGGGGDGAAEQTPASSGAVPNPSPAPTAAPSPAPAPEPPAWSLGPLYFVSGSGATLDLAATLPNGVVRGGAFGVSPGGAPLTAGMSLTQAGILSVGSATTGAIDGVVFTYAEPT